MNKAGGTCNSILTLTNKYQTLQNKNAPEFYFRGSTKSDQSHLILSKVLTNTLVPFGYKALFLLLVDKCQHLFCILRVNSDAMRAYQVRYLRSTATRSYRNNV